MRGSKKPCHQQKNPSHRNSLVWAMLVLQKVVGDALGLHDLNSTRSTKFEKRCECLPQRVTNAVASGNLKRGGNITVSHVLNPTAVNL